MGVEVAGDLAVGLVAVEKRRGPGRGPRHLHRQLQQSVPEVDFGEIQ